MATDVAVFPCSASQTRLWLLERLGRGGDVLVVRAPLALETAVSPERAAAALREVVRRHEALRTTFGEVDGHPVQRVRDDLELPLPVTDLRGVPSAARNARLRRLAEQIGREPFDLSGGPLLRAHLVLTGPASTVLLLALHHIVVDGWSVRILHDELRAVLGGDGRRPANLAALPVQYADYALWQAEARARPHHREHLDWWRALHADAPDRPPLFPPVADEPAGVGRRLERTLDAAVVARVRALAEERGATTFAALLAAFATIVARHTGHGDLVVGTPVAGRTRAELEGVVGFFVNTLPLRIRVTGDPWTTLLERVRDLAAEAFERQEVAYEEVVRVAGGPDRPMFEVMFNLLEGRALPETHRARGPKAGAVTVAGAHAALELYVFDFGDAMRLELVHDRSRIADPAADLLLDDLLALLAAPEHAPSGPARPSPSHTVRALPWSEEPAEQDLVSRFRGVAATHPDRIAVDDGRDRWTYAHLARRSRAVAGALAGAPDRGGLVGILADHDAHTVAATLGILAVGAGYVPLDPHAPAARLAEIVDDAELRLVLCAPGTAEAAANLAALRPILTRLDVAGIPDAAGDLLEAGGREAGRVSPDSLAYVLYTSGTTGTPKGVVQSHRNVLGHIRTYADALGIGVGDAMSLLPGLGTDAAVMDLFGALLTGARLHPVDLHDVALDRLPQRLAEVGVTVLHCTPSVFRALTTHLEVPGTTGAPLDTVRLLVLGGEAATRADLTAFRRHLPPSAVLVNGYGPTECTVATQFFATGTTSVSTAGLPLGDPVAGVSVAVLDDAGRPVPPGAVGEVVLTGRHVALGYLRRPEETARAFTAGPHGTRTYRTGDLARVHPDGGLTFAGRTDDQVKVRGTRVEPAEIEAALRLQEGVLAAGVTARSPLTAHLVLAPGHSPAPARLRRALRRLLPEPMVPARYVAVDRLPLTASGKIDRRALATVPARPLAEGRRRREPLSEPAAAVAEIWAEVLDLDVDEILPDDTFFDFGGHSLLLTQVAARLADRLGVRLPLGALFRNPTLADVASLAARERGEHLPGDDRIRPRTTPGPYPLSSAQARLWFLEELAPGSATYTIATSLPVPAAAGPGDVQAVVDDLVARHESLRTTFLVVDGQPMQEVVSSMSVPVHETDLSALDLPEARRRRDEIAARTAASGFDLRRGPLLRTHLVRHPAGGSLHLAIHHIVADGWSLRLLRDEFERRLTARLKGRAAPEGPPPLQYVDYVLWERGRPGRRDQGLAWWAEALAGAPPLLELPTDRPRPDAPSGRGELTSLSVDARLVRAARALAHRRGVTPFMVYLAAFATVLHRWSGQDDLVVGAPVAGRTRVETEDVVGLFVNSLPLFLRVPGEASFLDVLAGVRDVVTAAQEHQDVPLEEIVRRVAPQRRLAFAPIFQVMFALASTRAAAGDAGPGVAHTATAKFDLSMTVDDGDDPAVFLEYATDLYDGTAARHLLRATVHVLREAVADPHRPVRRMTLADEDDPAPAAATARPAAAPPGERLPPDQRRPAVTGPDGVLTHGDLAARTAALARALRRRGLGRGSVVGIDLPRGVDVVTAMLAIRAAGCAHLLLDPRLPERRRADLLRRSGGVLLTGSDLRAAAAADGREDGLEDGLEDGAEDAGPVTGTGPARNQRDPDAPAYVVATSGSTGEPKLVVVPNRALDAQVAALVEAYALTPADRVLQVASLGFDVALEEILPTLAAGGTVDLGPDDGPPTFESLEARCGPGGVSVLNLPASYWHAWVAALGERAGGPVLPAGLRLVVVGSEPVNPQVVARWQAIRGTCRLLCAYGTSETTITNALHEPSPGRDWAREARTPIGRALPTAHLLVVDPDGRRVPPGVLGELAVEGVCVADGYLDRPGLTAHRFVTGTTGRRYLTGDLARQRFDGALEVLGRLDDQVKLNGHRIEPGEVEAALLRRPGVADAAVALKPGRDGRAQLVGYVVPRLGSPLAPADLASDLARELPEHLVPAAFVVLETLPRLSGGKLDRAGLPVPDARPTAPGGPAPSGPFEQAVAEVWAQTLRVPVAAVSATSNFFALGGDSILSLQVAWRLGERGLAVTLADVFSHQTVAELASRIEAVSQDRAGVPAAAPVDEPADGPFPLTPIQQWHLGAGAPEPHHDNQAVLLRLEEPVAPAHMAAAIAAVVGTHDALRTRFRRGPDGWHGAVEEAPGAFALAVHPPEADLATVAALAHASLDLDSGPLLRADLLPLAAGAARAGATGGGRLLLVAHHLVVDLVSWQVLLHDLAAALTQLRSGAPAAAVRLAPVPTPWATWARRLATWASTEAAADPVRRWLEAAPAADDLLRLPATAGSGNAGGERVARAVLDAERTAVLLSDVGRLLDARLEEVLVAAVATAVVDVVRPALGPPAVAEPVPVLLDVEGHGRDPVLPGLDLSRTVGWFTTLRPVAVAVQQGSLAHTLRSTVTALRSSPGLAWGAVRHLREPGDALRRATGAVPPAEVAVNYLGRLDPGTATGLLRPAGPAPGPTRSPLAPRPYPLDLVAGIRDGELVLWLAHAGGDAPATLAAALLERCVEVLGDAAKLCRPAPDDAAARPERHPVASYPLTPMQEAMLHGAEAASGTGVYVEHSVVRLPAGTAAGALRDAWEAAVERHDVLRTRFVEGHDGTRRQEVLRHAVLPWRVVDWRHLPEPEALARLDGLLDDDRRRGFDPAEAPLMRVVLAHLPDGDRLVWSHHHAVLDGWSAAAVLDEVRTRVADTASGRGPRTPPAPRPFGDFVAWLQGRDPATDADHWSRELAGLGELLGHDGARLPRHDVGTGQPRARALGAHLPPDVADAVRARARHLHVSVATLLHAAWAMVLREHVRSDDVVLGVTAAGRPAGLDGAADMVGLFITTHPSRVRLTPQARLEDVVRDLAEREAVNREHAHAGLVAIARWAGLPPGTPPFESLLVVENYRSPGPAAAGRAPATAGTAPFEIHEVPVREIPDVPLSVVVGSDLHLTLLYDARRFDGAWVADVLLALVRTAGALATAADDARVEDVDVLGPDVRHRVLEEWNDTARPLPRRSLGAQWAEAARRYGDEVAVEEPGRVITYRELAVAADGVAARLRALGARPRELVGVVGPRGAELLAAVLGVVRAGCAYVPLDAAYPDERLDDLVRDTGMQRVLAPEALVPRLPAALTRNGLIPLDGLLDIDPASPPPALEDLLDDDVEAPAYVIYTSGSTGRPKGVVVPHRAVTRLVVNTDYCRLGPGDAVAFASTFAFDASTFEIWGALLTGARLVPVDTDTVLDPDGLAVALRDGGVTTIFLTTAAFNAVAVARPDAFAPLTNVLFGGERSDPRRVRDVLLAGPPRRLLHVYGPTEATTFASWYEVTDVAPDAATVPIGRPIANTTLLVLDASGRPVPPGVEGELVIGGPGLALGYLGDPGLSAQRFVPHPTRAGETVYRTGDVALQRPDGLVEIRGRRDGQVKIRGFRIEPGEVETHLRRAPGVAGAVVVPRRESEQVHFLAAYAVPEPGLRLTDADLRAYLRSHLPEHLVPATVTILDELPLNANGKVDRDRLPDPRLGPGEPGQGPASETEAAVARIWAEVLAMDASGVGPDQDFFTLGGHSLLLTQVAARLRRDLAVDVPLRTLFDARTPRSLAAVVEAADRTSDTTIPRLDRSLYRAQLDDEGRLTVPPALRERLRRVGS